MGTNEFSQQSVEQSLQRQRSRKKSLQQSLEQNLKEYEAKIDPTLEAILSGLEIQMDENSVAYKQLRRNFIKIHNLRLNWIEDLLVGKGRQDADFEQEAEELLGLDLYTRQQVQTRELPQQRQFPEQKSVPLPKQEPVPPSKIIEEYLDWKRLEKTADRTIGEQQSIIEEFFEISEIKSLREIMRKNWVLILQSDGISRFRMEII